ncbi:uncharacterized protein LOC8050878 isoform X1 [Ixodes scapularis]|uniref:uncharacterized protein LOC8050878 isoform X1 n=1 Tax=Ixodes scapularis TaxID=6945 RepID=UPI001C37FC17|nr:uncharacterized protein LOC8050878 isoform X1 [Ixodes scapularis]
MASGMLLRSRCKDGCRCDEHTALASSRRVLERVGSGNSDGLAQYRLIDFAPTSHSTPIGLRIGRPEHWAARQQGILKTESTTSLQKTVHFEDQQSTDRATSLQSTVQFEGRQRTDRATSLQETARFEDHQATENHMSESSTDRLRQHGWHQNGWASSSRSQWVRDKEYSESEEQVEQWNEARSMTTTDARWGRMALEARPGKRKIYVVTSETTEARHVQWDADALPVASPPFSFATQNLWRRVENFSSSVTRYMYLAACWLFVADTWLLSRVSRARRRWVLALLLPLLLWACAPVAPPLSWPSWGVPVTSVEQGFSWAGSTGWAALQGLAAFLPTFPVWSPRERAPNPCLSDDRLEDTVRSVLEQRIHHLEDKWSQQDRAHTQGTLEDLEGLKRRLEDQEATARLLLARDPCESCKDALAGTVDSRILVKLDEVLGDAKALRHSAGLTEDLLKREALLEESVALLGKEVAAAREAAAEARRLATLPREVPERRVAATSDHDETLRIVRDALRLYDADKTGQADFALESAGGSVVNTRCTETYSGGAIRYELLGFSLWTFVRTARTAIQPQMHPGECWAFRGSQGHLVVQLARRVRPTSFAVEHIPKELAVSGSLDSAPKDFHILGLDSETDHVGKLLGKYTYDLDGEPLQYFLVQDPDPGSFRFVEMKILSNHGHLEYTCLYRLRVHGVPSD